MGGLFTHNNSHFCRERVLEIQKLASLFLTQYQLLPFAVCLFVFFPIALSTSAENKHYSFPYTDVSVLSSPEFSYSYLVAQSIQFLFNSPVKPVMLFKKKKKSAA